MGTYDKGWSLYDLNPANVLDNHAIYVLDYKSQQTKIATYTNDVFHEFIIYKKISLDQCILLVQRGMPYFFKGKIKGYDALVFGNLLLNYIKQTDAYLDYVEQVPDFHRIHFILNLYPNKSKGRMSASITPYNETNIDVKDIITRSKQLAADDFSKNPSWFKTIGDPSWCFIDMP